MLKKLGLADLIAAIKSRVEQQTGYTIVSEGEETLAESYFTVQILARQQSDTEWMYCEDLYDSTGKIYRLERYKPE